MNPSVIICEDLPGMIPAGPKPRYKRNVETMVKVIHQAMIIVITSSYE
jgi:hypothetical protein